MKIRPTLAGTNIDMLLRAFDEMEPERTFPDTDHGRELEAAYRAGYSEAVDESKRLTRLIWQAAETIYSGMTAQYAPALAEVDSRINNGELDRAAALLLGLAVVSGAADVQDVAARTTGLAALKTVSFED